MLGAGWVWGPPAIVPASAWASSPRHPAGRLAASRVGAIPYFPPPSTWARGLSRLWENGTLRPAAGQTLVTFSLALLVATALGTAIGVIIGVSRRVDRALGPTLEFARAMPPSAMVPIAALLLGYDQRMKVA